MINPDKSTGLIDYRASALSGTVERNHRVFNEYLRSYMNGDDWEEHLKHSTFCYNISYNASNDHQYTPYEIVYGKQCNLPNT